MWTPWLRSGTNEAARCVRAATLAARSVQRDNVKAVMLGSVPRNALASSEAEGPALTPSIRQTALERNPLQREPCREFSTQYGWPVAVTTCPVSQSGSGCI